MIRDRAFGRLAAVCIGIAGVLPGLACAGSAADAAGDSRPNILLIVADDLRYADLGVYGSDFETPNIDALAARGMLFTQFHTAPMCAPTRSSCSTLSRIRAKRTISRQPNRRNTKN